MELCEVESVVKNILIASAYEWTRLTVVQREFEAATSVRLKEVAWINGFSSITDMMRTFQDFEVAGTGLMTCVKLDASQRVDRRVVGM